MWECGGESSPADPRPFHPESDVQSPLILANAHLEFHTTPLADRYPSDDQKIEACNGVRPIEDGMRFPGLRNTQRGS